MTTSRRPFWTYRVSHLESEVDDGSSTKASTVACQGGFPQYGQFAAELARRFEREPSQKLHARADTSSSEPELFLLQHNVIE